MDIMAQGLQPLHHLSRPDHVAVAGPLDAVQDSHRLELSRLRGVFFGASLGTLLMTTWGIPGTVLSAEGYHSLGLDGKEVGPCSSR